LRAIQTNKKNIYNESGLALNDAFCALNMAISMDGALIVVPPNVKLSKPVHIVNISFNADSTLMSAPQNIISVGKHSNLILFETYSSYSSDSTFTNAFTRITANNGAKVEHIRCQIENQNSYDIATTQSYLGESVQFSSSSIALGAKISRHSIKSQLNGEGIESVFDGIYMASDSQINDHHLVVEHIKPHCVSHEYFNGILSDKARGIFNGRIYVHPNALKTDAKQTNKNLLLSDDAVINSKPQLEIYADDVKCTHGATVGRLDQNAIFYLRSRGININDARRMLIWAFASEILDHINNQECRGDLEIFVANWLSNHFTNL
jgi:Fe-S cluster assembly protein SufD